MLSGPDVPLPQLVFTDKSGIRFAEEPISKPRKSTRAPDRPDRPDRPDIISLLADLSSVKKSEWIELLTAADIPFKVRPRDAARDILNRLFVHLKDNPEAKDRLRKAVSADVPRQRTSTLSHSLKALLEAS